MLFFQTKVFYAFTQFQQGKRKVFLNLLLRLPRGVMVQYNTNRRPVTQLARLIGNR
jgi:hypothetical protein